MNKKFSWIIADESADISKVIVFGSGHYGKSVIFMLKSEGVNVSLCFDNFKENEGKVFFNDVICIYPRFIKEDIPIIVSMINEKAAEQVMNQCRMMGYKRIYKINAAKLDKLIDELSDEDFLKWQYFVRMDGKILHLENPQTFNEKLQWLKLYDHNPKYTTLVDKCEVKKYVAEIIGEQYVIPTLGVWDKYEDIDYEQLPNQFVIKCTHDSGSFYIVKEKNNIDHNSLSKKFKRALANDYYRLGREWAYKNVIPRIIVEKYMTENNCDEMKDYKFMCFNGKVRCTFVCTNRFSKNGLKVTFYDKDWIKMPFERHYPSDEIICDRPYAYDEMVELAEKLSVGIPFSRIDFYEIQGRPYFGEITLYPGCGYEEFHPEEWDAILGSWLILPE